MTQQSAWNPAHLNGRRSVAASREYGYATITYEAFELRRERTGIHAKLYIRVNGATAAWSRINIEDSEDRVRLANKAHKQFGRTLGEECPATFVQTDLSNFCDQAYDAWMEQFAPDLLRGSLERKGTSFVIEPLVVADGGSIIFAAPGRGKSYTALLMAQSVNLGINKVFNVVQGIPSLYINLERSAQSMGERLGNVNAALEMDRDTPLHFLNARGKGLSDVYDRVERYLHDHGIGFVVLDSISRAGFAGSLIEDTTANKITDALNSLGVSWLAVGHTSRTDSSHIYGAIHFDAGGDVMIELSNQRRDDGVMGIGLQVNKENDIGKQPQFVLALSFDDKGLRDAWRAKARDFPLLAATVGESLDEELYEYVKVVGWVSATDAAKELGKDRANLSRIFKADARYQWRKNGHKVEYAVKSYA